MSLYYPNDALIEGNKSRVVLLLFGEMFQSTISQMNNTSPITIIHTDPAYFIFRRDQSCIPATTKGRYLLRRSALAGRGSAQQEPLPPHLGPFPPFERFDGQLPYNQQSSPIHWTTTQVTQQFSISPLHLVHRSTANYILELAYVWKAFQQIYFLRKFFGQNMLN